MAFCTAKIWRIIFVLYLLHLNFSSGQDVKGGYWFPESGIAASDINSNLFTHLFCAFANLDPQTHQLTVSSTDNASFAEFTAIVQRQNPSVKTLLSIGGGGGGGAPDSKTIFPSMASQSDSRKAFIDSSIELARSYGFSGLDLDWEYPQTSSDMANLGRLLDEWRAAVTADAAAGKAAPLILTAAVYFSPIVRDLRYPIQSINKNLDWLNLMAYDFYSPNWYKYTNSHSALYDPSGQISGSYGVGAWTQAGVNARKLVLGLPFYGYAWKLVDAGNHGVLAPASGPAIGGDGTMGYKEIKNFVEQNKAVVVFNSTVVTNYCYAGSTWIGFDDTQSIAAKVSYCKQRGLLGYFAWHVGADNNWALSQQAQHHGEHSEK